MLINQIQARQLKRNPLFISGLTVVLIAVLVSIGGAGIRPDSSPYANTQNLELAALKPMSDILFLKVEKNISGSDADKKFTRFFNGFYSSFDEIAIDSAGISGDDVVFRKYGQKKESRLPLVEVYYALGQPGIQPDGKIVLSDGSLFHPDLRELKSRNLSDRLVNKTFILGTDKLGRDLLSRLMSGTHISLSVGVISVLISLILGIGLGLMAGYYRGWTDRIIVWIINVIWSVPTLLLVISITLVLGKGFWQIFVAVGLTMWVEVARIVRGQVMSLREKEFIEAGIVLGFSHNRIIFNHILPNVLSPVIVISAANLATAVLLEAGLSFLGIGTPPPHATWGKMISEHKAYIITGDAQMAIIPGIAIMLLVLSFTFIGNGLRDALDEKSVKPA